ncbi:MAG: hypothetical protein WCG01_00285 [bacterium]
MSFFEIKVAQAVSITERMKNVGDKNFDTSASALTPAGVLGYLVSVFLGILGVIFVILIISAGYKWMMAGGDAKKIEESKDTIWRAVIGLIITVSAYTIQSYVFGQL